MLFRLQDEVVETISDIKSAGVKVWVLTGDKLETAISIGHSCSILTDRTYNAIVDGKSEEAVREQLHQYMSYIVAAQLASDAFEMIALKSVGCLLMFLPLLSGVVFPFQMGRCPVCFSLSLLSLSLSCFLSLPLMSFLCVTSIVASSAASSW